MSNYKKSAVLQEKLFLNPLLIMYFKTLDRLQFENKIRSMIKITTYNYL